MINYKMEQTKQFCPLCGRKNKKSVLKFYKFADGDDIGFCANPICFYNTNYDVNCSTPPGAKINILNPHDLMASFIIGEAFCSNKIPVLKYFLNSITGNKIYIERSYNRIPVEDVKMLNEYYEKVLEKRKFNWLSDYPNVPQNVIIKYVDNSIATHISALKPDEICIPNVEKFTRFLIDYNIAVDEDTFQITIVHLVEAHTLLQIKCNIFLSAKLHLENEFDNYMSKIKSLDVENDPECIDKYIAYYDLYKANCNLQNQYFIKFKELEACDELNHASKSYDRPNFSDNNNDVLNVDNKSCPTNKYKRNFDGFAEKISKVENCHDRLRFINMLLKKEMSEFTDSMDKLNITTGSSDDPKVMTNSGDKLNNNVSCHEQYVNGNLNDKQNTFNIDNDKINVNNLTNQLIIGSSMTNTHRSGNSFDICNNSKDIQIISNNVIDKANTTQILAYKIDIIDNTNDELNITDNSDGQLNVFDTSKNMQITTHNSSKHIGISNENLNIIDTSSRQQNNEIQVERNISVDNSNSKPLVTNVNQLIVFNKSKNKFNIIKKNTEKPNPNKMINISDKTTGKPNIFNIPASNLRIVKDPSGVQRILIESNFSNAVGKAISKPNITCNSTSKLNVVNNSACIKSPTIADSRTVNVNNKAAIPNTIGNFNNPLIINNEKLKKIPVNSAKKLNVCKSRGTLNNGILKRPITTANSNKEFIIIGNPNKKLKMTNKSESNERNIASGNSTKKLRYSFNMQNNTGNKQNGIDKSSLKENITNNNDDAKIGIPDDGNKQNHDPAPKQLTPAEELQAILRKATEMSAEKIESGYYGTNMNAKPKKSKNKSNTFKSKANPTNTRTHNGQILNPGFEYEEEMDLDEEEICDSIAFGKPTKPKKKKNRMQPISEALSKSIDRMLENTRRKIMSRQKDIPTVIRNEPIENDCIPPIEIEPVLNTNKEKREVKNIPNLKNLETPSTTGTSATEEVLETIDDTKISVLSDNFLTSLLE